MADADATTDPVPVPETRAWKFSHNNCPEIVLALPAEATEAEAVAAGLRRIGLTETPHPCRAWPAATN